MIIRTIAITVAIGLLAACDTEKGESAGDTQSSSTSGATDTGEGESSTGGTPEPTTTAGLMTATEGGSSTSTTTAGSTSATSGEETTTGGQPIDGDCEKFCQRFVECSLETPESAAVCVVDCSAEQATLEGECLAASTASLACVAGMTCEELQATGGGDLGPCFDEAATQHDLCGAGEGCDIVEGGDPEGTQCSFSRECPGQPKFEMSCDLESCECFVDGMLINSCEPEEICADLEQIDTAALLCCGF
ncbi:hypothetical protein [Nannocystis pusilla]|uniref:Lipoprotein n=1 Tax=Nannocystis pusilla TaxID=889268 RepID=A0ABS7TXE1_9BACT|nr:hypothetical protein [Nannocystis pusilla]MBZ5712866.1 hypothetical protein [Nannocystis pusilla]